MYKTEIQDVMVNGEKKPIEFYTLSVMEYYLGWRSTYIKELETNKLFPATPYGKKHNLSGNTRLYTKTMVEEAVELVENYYPIHYSGRDLILKEVHNQQKLAYAALVKELQEKWNTEDYLTKETATYRPLKRKENNG